MAILVLILTFGSLVAAGLPVLTALFGVGLGITGITAMTAFMDIGSTTPMLATMIGLAVGIDYALFILARYRSELDHTDDREEAAGIAVGTAGSAVVFAGLTVLIALSALSVVGIPFLTTMGIAAAATVFIAVLVALTLLPALLGLMKSKAFGGRVRRAHPKRDADGKLLQQRRPLGTLRRPQAGRGRDPGRGRPRRPRDPAEGPAPGVPQRQHRVLADHAAQGLRPHRRLLRPGPRRSAPGRRRRPRDR